MFVLEVMAVLVHCQNYTIFKNTVGNIFKVLIFKKINEVFLKSLNEINVTQTEQQKNQRYEKIKIEADDEIFETNFIKEDNKEKENYKASPYYKDLLPLKIETEKEKKK